MGLADKQPRISFGKNCSVGGCISWLAKNASQKESDQLRTWVDDPFVDGGEIVSLLHAEYPMLPRIRPQTLARHRRRHDGQGCECP